MASTYEHLTDAGAVELRDGRRLTYSAAGSPTGFPVLYLHGAIGSPRWRTPQLDALIAAHGIRYLIVNRPGFAGSDPSPGRSVADFASDVRELVDILGFDRFSVVGVSAGGPYALACAWELAERIVAAAIVSPLPTPEGLGGRLRYRLPALAFGAPVAGRVAAEALLRALKLRAATSPPAMVEDYAVCRREWGFDPAEVRIPVMLWHGAGDRLVPAEHAQRLAAAVPDCATFLTPKAGHFFYSKRLSEILSPLLPTPANEPPLRLAA